MEALDFLQALVYNINVVNVILVEYKFVSDL